MFANHWRLRTAGRHFDREISTSPHYLLHQKNVEEAVKACRYLVNMKKQPIASHLMYPAVLGTDDTDMEARTLGLMYGLSLLAVCDEVYVFETEKGLSEGMKQEIIEAKRLGKPIKYIKWRESNG